MGHDDATFDANDLRGLLARLGEVAAERGVALELVALGGAAIALLFDSRRTTRDVDVVNARPSRELVLELAAQVAQERGLPANWLSDDAAKLVPKVTVGRLLFQASGIRLHALALEQLLATKLDAMRDDVDRADAVIVAAELGFTLTSTELAIAPHLKPERYNRACAELRDIWEEVERARR